MFTHVCGLTPPPLLPLCSGVGLYNALYAAFFEPTLAIPDNVLAQITSDGYAALLPALSFSFSQYRLLLLSKTYKTVLLSSIPFDPVGALLSCNGVIGTTKCTIEGSVLHFSDTANGAKPDLARIREVQQDVTARNWELEASVEVRRGKMKAEKKKADAAKAAAEPVDQTAMVA